MEERTIVLEGWRNFKQTVRAYVTDVIFDKGCDGKLMRQLNEKTGMKPTGTSIPGRRNSDCKGPEVECVEFSRNSKEANVYGKQKIGRKEELPVRLKKLKETQIVQKFAVH